MFVTFTPHPDYLHFFVDPQDVNPQNQPLPIFEIQLSDVWIEIPELMEHHNVFAVWFPNDLVQIEVDTNNILTIWQIVNENHQELYVVPISSPLLAEEIKQQFRIGMPESQVTYSRFAENNEMNNASTITVNDVEENRGLNTMNGGQQKQTQKRKFTKSRRISKKRRMLRRTRKTS